MILALRQIGCCWAELSPSVHTPLTLLYSLRTFAWENNWQERKTESGFHVLEHWGSSPGVCETKSREKLFEFFTKSKEGNTLQP